MSKGTVNKVILIGRLGADPELRYTPSGRPVANFRLATNESWKDKEGQQQERTEWHTIVIWDKQAEIAGEYLRKGSLIYVEGRLQTREFGEQENQKKRTTEIVVQRFQMLNKPPGSTGSTGSRPADGQPLEEPAKTGDKSGNTNETDEAGDLGGDDDLPF